MTSGSAITEQDLLRWSEMLSALARTGLAFSDSLYEQERFEEILAVAAEIASATTQPLEPERLVEEWLKTVGHGVPGYVTPKTTVGAIVGNDDGEILLVQRSDSGMWLYPTGWADVGYSPAEVAVKEVWEEAGIKSEVVRLLAVNDGMRLGFTRIPLYSTVFHLRAIGGEVTPHPLECTDAGFFRRDNLPEPLIGAERWVDRAFAAIAGEELAVHFDDVRTPPWEQDHA